MEITRSNVWVAQNAGPTRCEGPTAPHLYKEQIIAAVSWKCCGSAQPLSSVLTFALRHSHADIWESKILQSRLCFTSPRLCTLLMASAKEASPKLRDSSNDDAERHISVANVEKGRWERLWPVIACGAGLFSDGYLNNVRNSNATCSLCG